MPTADVPLEIRQKLTGHASQDMNKHYTHLELETVRRGVEAISRLPGKLLTQPNKGADELRNASIGPLVLRHVPRLRRGHGRS
jgi:hypothetical protein